jgi:hypothetical protein
MRGPSGLWAARGWGAFDQLNRIVEQSIETLETVMCWEVQ